MPRKTSREKIKTLIRDLKKNAPCADCNENIPGKMTFDHQLGELKRFDLARSPKYPIKVVLAEIKKCQIVCNPCHKVREDARLKDPVYQETKKAVEVIAKVFLMLAILSGSEPAYKEYRDISKEKEKKKKDRTRYKLKKQKEKDLITLAALAENA